MDEGIDLRAYAEVLWRGRYVVGLLTLGAALLAFMASRFLLAPVYEASTLLVVEAQSALPASVLLVAGTPGGDAVEQLSQLQLKQLLGETRPGPLDARSYQGIAQSPAFRREMARRAEALFGKKIEYNVRARVLPQTALLELTAEAGTPEQASRLANEASSLLLEQARRLNQSRVERALALLEGQVNQAREKLDQAVQRLQVFTRQGPGVSEQNGELNSKLQLLGEYQKRLIALDVTLASETTKLRTLQDQLAREPQTAGGAQAFNPVYVDLRRQVAAQEAAVAGLRAEQATIKTTIGRLSQEVQGLSSTLVGLTAEERELTWQLESARRTYEMVVGQHEEQKVAMAARLGESALSLVQPAPVPEAPVRPRALLNAVVAGFLGLMASIMGLFIADFWRRPAGVSAAPSGAVAAPGPGV